MSSVDSSKFFTDPPADLLASERLGAGDAGDLSVRAAVLRLVRAHADGITTPEIASALGIAPQTVRRACLDLEREREMTPRAIGKTVLWVPTGSPLHPYLEFFKEIRGKPYRFSVINGRRGARIQIQERSYSLVDGERVEGGIFLEAEALDEFLDALSDLKVRHKQIETKTVKK